MSTTYVPAGKTAFITGGNRGIGLETARGLAKLGMRVLIGARDAKKGESAAETLRCEGLDVASIKCDILNEEDRNELYTFIDKTMHRLDVLVNNAGVWLESENSSVGDIPNVTSTISETMVRETFEANFFAPFLLTQKLLPLIRRSDAGRIVITSSVLGSHTLHADPSSPVYGMKVFAYNASKAALNALTTHLAHELRDTPIKVNSIHPGWVRSAMGGPGAEIDEVEGSLTGVKYATLPADGPSGGFFHKDQTLPW